MPASTDTPAAVTSVKLAGRVERLGGPVDLAEDGQAPRSPVQRQARGAGGDGPDHDRAPDERRLTDALDPGPRHVRSPRPGRVAGPGGV